MWQIYDFCLCLLTVPSVSNLSPTSSTDHDPRCLTSVTGRKQTSYICWYFISNFGNCVWDCVNMFLSMLDIVSHHERLHPCICAIDLNYVYVLLPMYTYVKDCSRLSHFLCACVQLSIVEHPRLWISWRHFRGEFFFVKLK